MSTSKAKRSHSRINADLVAVACIDLAVAAASTDHYDAHVLDTLCRFLDVQMGDFLIYTPDDPTEPLFDLVRDMFFQAMPNSVAQP